MPPSKSPLTLVLIVVMFAVAIETQRMCEIVDCRIRVA